MKFDKNYMSWKFQEIQQSEWFNKSLTGIQVAWYAFLAFFISYNYIVLWMFYINTMYFGIWSFYIMLAVLIFVSLAFWYILQKIIDEIISGIKFIVTWITELMR